MAVDGHTGVDNVHSTHGTTGVVEHPLLMLVQVGGSDLLLELGNDVVDDGAGVFAVGLDGALGKIVQMLMVEDVELVQARVKEGVDGGEEGQEDGDDAQSAKGEAAAAAGRLLASIAG
jgi:hypothetical protein